MKRMLRRMYGFGVMAGIDPRKTFRLMRGLPLYLKDLSTLKQQRVSGDAGFPLGPLFPCIADRFEESGSAKGHYFHQDLLVARKVHEREPEVHMDVGSRIDGFVAHVASFRPIVVLDVRPLENRIKNIRFMQADLMAPLRDDLVESCDSLSCLHALEHFGLGRYGDPVRNDGHLQGLENLARLLRVGGRLYLSVPIGPQRIEFNAHRVFSVRHVLDILQPNFRVDNFSYVDDSGDLHEDAALTAHAAENSFGCVYGCGIFEATKI